MITPITLIHKCGICNKEVLTIFAYKRHIRKEHTELNRRKINRLLRDLDKKLYTIRKVEKETIELMELKDIKQNIIFYLKKYQLSQDIYDKINNSSSKEAISTYLSVNLCEQVIKQLKTEDLDFFSSLYFTKKKKSTASTFKSKSAKNYFDRTTSSIKAILTPMGNKK